ncbi:TonB-dependent receptor [Sphingomonas sp. Leaf67]|uniref:TonB-dependent receptor n=1 Tax=Sphingomonas sp. Leaf67 TaxID=1736230 RepID=UPI0006FACCE4|nr:TonB-dependent receptor [Sphingomonas sp. Leaf67]KQN79813.1 TonB-dependent receptor [Sphingomonas sp. Leaf67]
MNTKLHAGVAFAALLLPASAFAQSTGSTDFESEDIVVTGSRTDNGVDGIKIPDGPKARVVLDQEFLAKQTPGNTVLDALNIVPGVNFTQSDPFGSSGGNIRIRGFDGNRVSLTFDGFPLNDSGNYAIYSNQQLDPELVDEINVNLGATDIDSPTASAAGGTINYRTLIPSETLSATMVASYGDFDFHRVFGLIETGNLTSFGTRAFLSASTASNDKFRGPGEIRKQQFNAGIYQPLGDNGDFIRVSGHYNENRNNFYRAVSVGDMRTLFGTGVIPANASASPANPIRIDLNEQQFETVNNFENNEFCNRPTPVRGTAQNEAQGDAANCSNYYGIRVNPSNTGNIRANSRFTLSDKLTLTLDGSYQYTLAHGGGTSTLAENSARAKGGLTTSAGVDFNGDGDVLDTVRFFSPNITNTNRYTGIASLRYDITEDQRVRVAYTYDNANHRQTGEWGNLFSNGMPEDIFSGRNGRPVLTADGFTISQRDRESTALLNQVSGEYIGRFFDRAFTLQVGLRAPFFKRDLQTNCPIEARGSGFAYCTSEPLTSLRIIAPDAVVPTTGATPYYAPFATTYKYDAILPNAGFTYNFVDTNVSMFGSYAKGFSAPRTDNLYRAPFIGVQPEKTDSFDLGLRYNSRMVQSQLTGWYIKYKNRIVSSFDFDQGISFDRNIGAVDSYGFDGTVTVRPTTWLGLTAIASYTHTELLSNVQTTGTAVAQTKGKAVPETPEWQFGGRAEFNYGPVNVGVQGKWVDERFLTDLNDVVVGAYTLVDLDARFSLEQYGLAKTNLSLNVRNLFNERYFGNISTQVDASSGNPNLSVGYPRTVIGSIKFGF